MINKIKLIRNIGQFESVCTGNKLPFKRLTLIHAENGRGKTTLTAIMRSLTTGNPSFIEERTRVKAQGKAHVELEINDDFYIFKNNNWNQTLKNIDVFDDIFTEKNIYSGLSIDPKQRQNLHSVVMGEIAVKLSKKLEAKVEKIREHNRKLKEIELKIKDSDIGPFAIKEFCELKSVSNIDNEIQKTEYDLTTINHQDGIRKKPNLETLDLPSLNLSKYEKVIQHDLGDIECTALNKVQNHIQSLGADAEKWIAEGMAYIASDSGKEDCPFCAQDLRGLALIQHYKSYFSNAYNQLKDMINESLEQVNKEHNQNVMMNFREKVSSITASRNFWSEFCDISELDIDTSVIISDWKNARNSLINELEVKNKSPLDRFELSSKIRSAVEDYETHRKKIQSINQIIKNTNKAIETIKRKTEQHNLQEIKQKLSRLQATKIRYKSENSAICEEYMSEEQAKIRTENERGKLREELETYRGEIFPKFQEAINPYISKFNANFKITNMKSANIGSGKGSTCTYNLMIDDVSVSTNKSDKDSDTPYFGNTLSSGDRNTLALAFFFASLNQNQDMSEKIVIIDDPTSSLDEHRMEKTIQEIISLVKSTEQVIVLSHNKSFLCQIWNKSNRNTCSTLELVRCSVGSTLQEWNVKQELENEHHKRFSRFQQYIEKQTGNKHSIATDIRNHLEFFCHIAYPADYPPRTMLGQFINKCEKRLNKGEAILDEERIAELKEISKYANKFHHSANPAWENDEVNDTELVSFVKRTLAFTRVH